MKYPDGVPCQHPGCLSHISHPCEGCGRIGGRTRPDFINGTGSESDLKLEGLQYCIGDEDHPVTSWPTYGGIRRGSGPHLNYTKTEGGSITPEMIANTFSPERLLRERQMKMKMNYERAKFMQPFSNAPSHVYLAAWRLSFSGSVAPLHQREYEQFTEVVNEWKTKNESE